MTFAVQCALFEQADRRPLGDGAWLDVSSGWLEDGDRLFDELAATTPWRAERRPMYDRVVDVPRLVSFPILGPSQPLIRGSPNCVTASTTPTPTSSANRSPPRACACTATAATASHGTATRSGAAASRTPWWRSSASAPPGCARYVRAVAEPH